jgi:hypothetical protein
MGTISAFAFRHRETKKKNLCRDGMVSIKLYVSVPECNPQGVNQNKDTQVQPTNSGTDRSVIIKILYY